METCFNYCDKDVAFFSSDERRWITKIRKLKEKHPDEITILAEPETNDGCIYCRLPTSWLKVAPKKRVSEEVRRLSAERFKNMRASKSK